MCEKAVGTIRRALEQFGDEAANPPASPWPGALVRKLRFLGVGFFFMLFSQAFEDRHFRKIENFWCKRSCQNGFASKIMRT
jgi:hypothetical protein